MKKFGNQIACRGESRVSIKHGESALIESRVVFSGR